ncbi:MAG TPA: hypothetical protein VNI84_13015 [Pyrinomonadaceae bacterium]|nr:hypothetical protein [Pyrinomonadaceae bacterium]
MKTNKNFLMLIALFAFLAFSTVSANAQRRRTPAKRTPKPAAATATIAPSSAEIKEGAEKVSTQLKNVTKFIYVLGGVAGGIEDIDKDSGKVSRAAADLNGENKQKVIQTIRNLRAGLAALEVEFRIKPALKNYLFQINGITDISGSAEDEAAAGQFVQSGKTLLLVVEKLADTLAALP